MIFIGEYVGKSVSRVDTNELRFVRRGFGIPHAVRCRHFAGGLIFGVSEYVQIVTYLGVVVKSCDNAALYVEPEAVLSVIVILPGDLSAYGIVRKNSPRFKTAYFSVFGNGERLAAAVAVAGVPYLGTVVRSDVRAKLFPGDIQRFACRARCHGSVERNIHAVQVPARKLIVFKRFGVESVVGSGQIFAYSDTLCRLDFNLFAVCVRVEQNYFRSPICNENDVFGNYRAVCKRGAVRRLPAEEYLAVRFGNDSGKRGVLVECVGFIAPCGFSKSREYGRVGNRHSAKVVFHRNARHFRRGGHIALVKRVNFVFASVDCGHAQLIAFDERVLSHDFATLNDTSRTADDYFRSVQRVLAFVSVQLDHIFAVPAERSHGVAESVFNVYLSRSVAILGGYCVALDIGEGRSEINRSVIDERVKRLFFSVVVYDRERDRLIPSRRLALVRVDSVCIRSCDNRIVVVLMRGLDHNAGSKIDVSHGYDRGAFVVIMLGGDVAVLVGSRSGRLRQRLYHNSARFYVVIVEGILSADGERMSRSDTGAVRSEIEGRVVLPGVVKRYLSSCVLASERVRTVRVEHYALVVLVLEGEQYSVVVLYYHFAVLGRVYVARAVEIVRRQSNLGPYSGLGQLGNSDFLTSLFRFGLVVGAILDSLAAFGKRGRYCDFN